MPLGNQAIVLFAHGAREPRWAEPFIAIRERVALRCPEVRVELAFLELMSPLLEQAVMGLIEGGITAVLIVPLFLAQGSHLRQDLPRLVERLRKGYPAVTFRVTSALGDEPTLLEAMAGWVETCYRTSPSTRS